MNAFKKRSKIEKNLIVGMNPVTELIRANKPVDRLIIQNSIKNKLPEEIIDFVKTYKLLVQYVPSERINRLAPGKNHQGIAAFSSIISYQPIEEVIAQAYEKGEVPLLLLLDKIQDVRNFGAITRTAECAGVHAVIIPYKGMAHIGYNAIKASAGALNHINICRAENLEQTIQLLKQNGIKVVAVSEKAEKIHIQANVKDPVAFLMGNEEYGIAPELLKWVDEKIRIPMFGKISSLNVSVATSIVLYEAVRQRFEQ